MGLLNKQTNNGTENSGMNGIKAKLKRIKKWQIALIILIIAALIFFPKGGKTQRKAVDISYSEAEAGVRTITKSLTGSGTLKPANSYTVVTLVEGDVLQADFEEGDVVEKDDVLYRIDNSNAASNIEKAQISYNQTLRSYNNSMDSQYVKAGAAGQVVSLDVKVGDEVKNGQTIGTIRDSAKMSLKVVFPSDDAQTFHVGQAATVTLDSTFEELSGVVTEISGADIVGIGNTITRNVTVEVSNPGGLTDTQNATVCVGGIYGSGSGTFKYNAESTLTASASGTITKINAPEGSMVSKNQIVVTLGGKDIENTLQNASDSLRNAQISMDNTQDQLDNYTVTSPISGTIVDKSYKAGDTVESGKTLCTIYDLSYLEMTLNIDELDIMTLAIGQNVSITADAVSGKTFRGTVTKVSVAGTTSSGTTSYPVTIRIDDTDGLLPGMNVDAEIVIESAENVLAIPSGAVSRGNKVLVTKDSPSAVNALEDESPDANYVYVSVVTGISDDSYVQIVSGLQQGDKVAYIKQSGDMGFNMNGMPGMGGGMPGMGGNGGMPSGEPSGGGMPSGGPSGGQRPSGGPGGF